MAGIAIKKLGFNARIRVYSLKIKYTISRLVT